MASMVEYKGLKAGYRCGYCDSEEGKASCGEWSGLKFCIGICIFCFLERKYDTLNSDFFGERDRGQGSRESHGLLAFHTLRCCLNVLTMHLCMQHLNNFFQQRLSRWQENGPFKIF